jgi:hypothetical protein
LRDFGRLATVKYAIANVGDFAYGNDLRLALVRDECWRSSFSWFAVFNISEKLVELVLVSGLWVWAIVFTAGCGTIKGFSKIDADDR